MIFVFLLILGFLPAVVAAVLATNRQRSGGLWFFLGFLFSWLAVLVVACLSSQSISTSDDEYQPHVPSPSGPRGEIRLAGIEEWSDFRDFRDFEIVSVIGPKPTKPVPLPEPSRPLETVVHREPKLSDDKYQASLGLLGSLVPMAATKKNRQATKETFAEDHAEWEKTAAKIEGENHEGEIADWKEQIKSVEERNEMAEAEYSEQITNWRRKGESLLKAQMTDEIAAQKQGSKPATEKIQLSLEVESKTSPVQLWQEFLALQEQYQPYKALLVTFKEPTHETSPARFLSIRSAPDFQKTALEFITQEEFEQWEKTKLGDLIILHGPMA